MVFKTKRLLGVCASGLLLMILAGCETAKDDDTSQSSSFSIVTPVEGNTLVTTNPQIKIKYTPPVDNTNIQVTLNGADITSVMNISDFHGVARVELDVVQDALQPGLNTIIATNLDDGTSRTFEFIFDNYDPEIEITSVVPTVTDLDGRPAAGASITVTGNIIDPSNIETITFSGPGGVVELTEVFLPLGVNEFSNEPDGSGYKTFSVTLDNYPDITAVANSHHFSYTVTDVLGQSTTKRYIASGSRTSNGMVTQINHSLDNNLKPLIHAAILEGVDRAKDPTFNIFQIARPQVYDGIADTVTNNSPIPAKGERMESPANDVEYNATLLVEEFNQPDSTYCIPTLFDASAWGPSPVNRYCVVFIRDVNIKGPDFNVVFSGDTDEIHADLNLFLQEATVEIEIAAVSYNGIDVAGDGQDIFRYRGALSAIVGYTDFFTTSGVDFFVDRNFKLGFARNTPFTIDPSSWNDGPGIWNLACNICQDDYGLIFQLGLFIYAMGGDLDGDGKSEGQQISEALSDLMESVLGPAADDALGTPTPAETEYDDPTAVLGALDELDVMDFSTVTALATVLTDNAFFRAETGMYVAPVDYRTNYVTVNGGLGSPYQPTGCFVLNLTKTGCGNNWPEQINNSTQLDYAVAISASRVNQYLLAKHQWDGFEGVSIAVTGVNLPVTGIVEIDRADQLQVSMSTGEAPTVEFVAETTSLSNFCVPIFGKTYCSGNTRPGSVKFKARNLTLYVENVTDGLMKPTPQIEVNIDLSLELYVMLDENSQPVLALVEDSIDIVVNDVVQPAGLIGANGAVSQGLSSGLQTYFENNNLLTEFMETAITYNIDTEIDPIDIDGTLVFVSDLFADAIPREYGMVFRRFTIERGGSYLSIGIDIRNVADSNWTAQQLLENFITVRVEP